MTESWCRIHIHGARESLITLRPFAYDGVPFDESGWMWWSRATFECRVQPGGVAALRLLGHDVSELG